MKYCQLNKCCLLFLLSLIISSYQLSYNKTIKRSPKDQNRNFEIIGSWKIDSIQLSTGTIKPKLEAYIFDSTEVRYLKGQPGIRKESQIGTYSLVGDLLDIIIEKPTSGDNTQKWKVMLTKKKLIMYGLYKTSRGESPIIYMTKSSYEKLNKFSKNEKNGSW